MSETTNTTDFEFSYEDMPKLTDYALELAIKNPKSMAAWALRCGLKELQYLRRKQAE